MKGFSLLTAILLSSFVSTTFAYNDGPVVDYVIVGTGTAGAVLAKKLSDNRCNSVIALQTGKNYNHVPVIKYSKYAAVTVLDGLIGPPFYINGDTTPQANADDRQLLWVQATPLGGASAINAGAYCRGTNQLFQQWETIAGPLWSVNRITAIYKELERYNGETPNPIERGYHGRLFIHQVQNPSAVSQKFTQAIINATGFPFVLDYNDPLTPIGASSQLQYTQAGRDGKFRVSSGVAFLDRTVMTPSGFGLFGRKLRVLFQATATKVIWDGNLATGVEFLYHGKTRKIYARKGVIVCAGLMSSAFLMHSGVGPKSLLDSLGIPVVYDNPNVGQSLTDQTDTRLLYTANPLDTPISLDANFKFLKNDISRVAEIVNSELGKQFISLLDLPGNLNQKCIRNNASVNGLFSQIAWLPAPGGDPTIRELRFATINPFPGIVLALFDLVQQKSLGSITIDSTNPLAPPVIDLGILSNPDDLNLYVNGFQVYIKAINAALQAIDPQYQLIYPDPAIIDDVAILTAFIKQNVFSNMHFQGHCRMAPLNQGGVVDSTGHVYGVRNLIVADNSINPVGMDGSPMATGYLVAANIAKILLES